MNHRSQILNLSSVSRILGDSWCARPPIEELKETFLTTLQEQFWTTLAVVDFSEKMIEQVMDWVLVTDNTQTNNNMSMAKDDEIQFRQASNAQLAWTRAIRQSSAH